MRKVFYYLVLYFEPQKGWTLVEGTWSKRESLELYRDMNTTVQSSKVAHAHCPSDDPSVLKAILDAWNNKPRKRKYR